MTAITLTVAPANGKPSRLVEASAGDVVYRDAINTDSATARKRFVVALAEKIGATVESVSHVDDEIIRRADEADEAAERASNRERIEGNGQRRERTTGAASRGNLRIEDRTDSGNAKRFLAEHGERVRYVGPWGKWLIWDGRRWKLDDTCAIEHLAKQTADGIWADVLDAVRDSDKGAGQLIGFAKASNSAKGVRDLLAMARSDRSIAILPDVLDSDPWLLNVENGTVDLRTCDLLPHRREDLITKIAPVTFNAEADCPTWRKFIGEIFADNQDLIRFVRRAAGMTLTGRTTDHVLFFCYGNGANGKSTFLNTLMNLMGPDYALKAPPDLLTVKTNESHPTERADLHGKRLVACVETEEGKRLAESLMKDLTGGEKITARRMREDFWEFDPTHKIWLASNHKPIIRGTDHGVWRRIKMIPFDVQFSDDQQDRQLPDKLRAESSGILNWLLMGCGEWQEHGLGEPEIVRAATAGYRESMDVLGQFIAAECLVGPGVRVRASALYSAYKRWADASGERTITQREFGETMTERGFDRVLSAGTWYVGIALAAHNDHPEL